jgi:hypothetical protein
MYLTPIKHSITFPNIVRFSRKLDSTKLIKFIVCGQFLNKIATVRNILTENVSNSDEISFSTELKYFETYIFLLGKADNF